MIDHITILKNLEAFKNLKTSINDDIDSFMKKISY